MPRWSRSKLMAICLKGRHDTMNRSIPSLEEDNDAAESRSISISDMRNMYSLALFLFLHSLAYVQNYDCLHQHSTSST